MHCGCISFFWLQHCAIYCAVIFDCHGYHLQPVPKMFSQ
uniref:Uncharacterized protein n=1 Tax=Anguilla anguilla TaxID=7936 RepID=A0A0E9S9X5_ANGAN